MAMKLSNKWIAPAAGVIATLATVLPAPDAFGEDRAARPPSSKTEFTSANLPSKSKTGLSLKYPAAANVAAKRAAPSSQSKAQEKSATVDYKKIRIPVIWQRKKDIDAANKILPEDQKKKYSGPSAIRNAAIEQTKSLPVDASEQDKNNHPLSDKIVIIYYSNGTSARTEPSDKELAKGEKAYHSSNMPGRINYDPNDKDVMMEIYRAAQRLKATGIDVATVIVTDSMTDLKDVIKEDEMVEQWTDIYGSDNYKDKDSVDVIMGGKSQLTFHAAHDEIGPILEKEVKRHWSSLLSKNNARMTSVDKDNIESVATTATPAPGR